MKLFNKKFLVFFLVFMSIQYLFYISELFPYFNMISDIQGYKFNWYKDLNNNLVLKNVIIMALIVIIYVFMIYYYIIKENKSLLEGFCFSSLINALWDGALFSLFDKAVSHSQVLCYDIFIVGGVGMVITQYLFYNYYDTLKKNIWLLFLLYILTMLLFFYFCYRYNPDLSNIKGVVLF